MKVTPSKAFIRRSSTGKIDDITLANTNVALKYKELNSVLQPGLDSGAQPYDLDVSNYELSRFGIGMYLFLEFLKWIAIIFFAMSILASINCYFNSTGTGLSSYQNLNKLQTLSVGNQDQLSISSNSTSATNTVLITNFYNNSQTNHNILSWLDFVQCVIYFLFIVVFGYWSDRTIKYHNKNSRQPATFSAQIFCLPSRDDVEELKQFLNRYTPIVEVKFARVYYDTLFLHKREADLLVKISIENMKIGTSAENQKKIAAYNSKLVKVQDKMEQIVTKKLGITSKHDSYPIYCAFVIFETIRGKEEFIKNYYKLTHPSFWDSCCNGKVISEENIYKNQILQIRDKVDNPSNIKWENLEVPKFERFWRLLIVYFVVFVLMIITFVIVFGANVVSKYDPSQCPKNTYTYAQTLTLISQATTSSAQSSLQQCFCFNLNSAELYGTYSSYCNNVILIYTGRQAIQIASAFVVIIVNMLLKLLISNVTGFVRYPTVSSQLSGTFTKLFVVTFINTALIALLLNSDIYGFKISIYIASPIPELQSGSYNQLPDDFNRQWYATTGASLINTWIINMISPYLIELLLLPIVRYLRNRKAAKAVIQRDMNNAIVGPELQLALHYATMLNTIFVTLFYSSAIPLMLPMGAVALSVQYFSLKYMILRFYKKPVAYDEVLHQTMMPILPFAILIHLLIAIWVYGEPFTFPDSANTLSIVTTTSGSTVTANINNFWQRISATPQLSILFAVYVCFIMLKYILIDPMRYLCGLCFNDDLETEQQAAKNVKFSDIVEELNHDQLATYEIRKNEAYHDMIIAMDKGALRDTGMKEENIPLKGDE